MNSRLLNLVWILHCSMFEQFFCKTHYIDCGTWVLIDAIMPRGTFWDIYKRNLSVSRRWFSRNIEPRRRHIWTVMISKEVANVFCIDAISVGDRSKAHRESCYGNMRLCFFDQIWIAANNHYLFFHFWCPSKYNLSREGYRTRICFYETPVSQSVSSNQY